MSKIFPLIGTALAFISVAAGAFGAHALKQKLSPDLLNVFEVGVRYQMYHALALFAVSSLQSYSYGLMTGAGWVFIAGTAIFSGSLYLLALTGIRSFGAVTPIGGVLLLLGWALFAIGIAKG